MEKFFEAGDVLQKLLANLKKKSNYTEHTKLKKVDDIEDLLKNLKKIIIKSKNSKDQKFFKTRYLQLKGIARQCLKLLKANQLDRTETEFDEANLEHQTTTTEQENSSSSSDEYEDIKSDFNSNSEEEENETDEEEELDNMAPKLDLSLALKVVKPFDGSAQKLMGYIESVELLTDYAEGVPEATIIKFLKTTLVGAAHGAIDNATTIAQAFEILKTKFAVKLTPKAVENEMTTKKQHQKTISDFGTEIETLSAKLAAAHVSMGTFQNEAAAVNIVEPIAVQSFIDGLKDPSTRFFLKARNPLTLNKAISDALECTAGNSKTNEEVMWFNSNSSRSNRGHYNGNRGTWRGRNRGFPTRGNYRGRGNYQQNNRFQGNYRRGNHHQPNENRPYHENNNDNNPNNNSSNRNNSNRGRQQTNRHANVAEEQNVNHEEVINHFDLFRE